ncbi:MAG: hypothetical protein AOA65_0697 [Candidatus Bathyarchaeota archaeon BA1]|nr:MAG: hypothetical protein AOA65_0697 [Candidatus Bathyarchaeota archaeon BA1]
MGRSRRRDTEIMEHRIRVGEARRLEKPIRLPPLTYTTPLLPQIEEKPEVFVAYIDTDGMLTEVYSRRDRVGRIDRVLYRYEYRLPEVSFTGITST